MSSGAAAARRDRVKQQVCRRVDELASRLVGLSHRLHRHPELSLREERSSAMLADFSVDHGLRVRHPAFGLPTAFHASSGDRGRSVVVCCEYDALPGLGHACGHNIVAAAGLGAVAALVPWARRGLGTVVALGTPGEENGGGKIVLLDRGAFAGASAVLLAHPGAHDTVDARFRAASSLRVAFRGVASHAAMAPERGRNALDAAVLTLHALSPLRSGPGWGAQVTTVIRSGGEAANVVPDRTEIDVLVRAETAAGLAALRDAVRRAADAGALATGCRTAVVTAGATYLELRSDPWLSGRCASNMGRLGREVVPQGDRAVMTAGSTDLGNVSHQVATAHPKLAVSAHPQHSRAFARDAVSPAGDRAVVDGAKVLAMTVVDVWMDEERVEGGRT